MDRRSFLRTSTLVPLALAASGCGATEALWGTQSAVRVAVSWSGIELAAFREVLAGLGRIRPELDYEVGLIPYGDNIDAALAARGTPRPDIVMLPRPGRVREVRDELEPLDSLWRDGEYASEWRDLLSDNGRVYGIPFKAANKSVVWYRKDVLGPGTGLDVPADWDSWLRVIDALRGREPPIAPLALGAADGWMLTDFFENVLLATAPDVYREFAVTRPPRSWNEYPPKSREDPVGTALRSLGEVWRKPGVFAGGVGRSLTLQYPDALYEVFAYRRAAMAVAPDFAESVISQIHPDPKERSERVGVFRFPRMSTATEPPLVAGGDVIVVPKPASPAALDLARRLADPSAPLPWIADPGGFIAPDARTNRLPEVAYSPELARTKADLESSRFAFDLSDQLGAVGGWDGLWRALTDFLIDVGEEGSDTLDASIEQVKARLMCTDIQQRLAESGLPARVRRGLEAGREEWCERPPKQPDR